MINTRSQTIDGQLAVGRSISVGGEVVTQGGATVNHDLNVKGRIIARDIQGNNKGLFSSPDSLMAAYKKPLPGWYAYVESNGDPIIYVVENGEWTPSHIDHMVDYVDLYDYKESLQRVEDQFTEDIETLDEDLATEISDRQAAILQEQQQRTQADNDLTTAIGNEATARESADTELDGKITDETQARQAALAAEKEARTNAIAAETTAREAAIIAEQTARETADTELDGKITDETQARQDDVETINDALIELGKSVWPLQAELSVTPTLVEYTNGDHNVQISREVRRNNSIVSDEDLTSLRVSHSYNGESTDIDQERVSSKVFNSSVKEYGTHLFSVQANAFDMSLIVSREVIVELPMYFGFSIAANASALNITSLQKQSLKTSPSGTYSLTNDTAGKHLWLCVPSRMSISKVTSNGFDVPMLAAETKNSGLGDYKCYRTASESGINQGTIKITIS